ncbi:hypothetical protein U0070_015965 [Myodes glareolus]|uniref:Secreted protein n=1 Tax=Myodes glareolus TaxID=447135 RepID=A0AAW0H8D9_MYOGA
MKPFPVILFFCHPAQLMEPVMSLQLVLMVNLIVRHIMQYEIPLNCVQPNPLITSEQQLNVNSLNLTSTSLLGESVSIVIVLRLLPG